MNNTFSFAIVFVLALIAALPPASHANYKCALVAASIKNVKPIKNLDSIVVTDRLALGFKKTEEDPERLTIVNRESEQPVGVIWVRSRGATEVQMPLSITAKGKRYGLEAKFALLKFAFEQLGITTVRDEINDSNTPSINLHLKLGFLKSSEGDGESFLYSLSKEQFLELEKKLSTPEARRQYFQLP